MNKEQFIEKFKEYDNTNRKIYMKIEEIRGQGIGDMKEEFYEIKNSAQLSDFLDRLYNKLRCDSYDFNYQTRESFDFCKNDKWVDGETHEPVEYFYHLFKYCLYKGCNGQVIFYIRFVDMERLDEFLSEYKEPYRSMAYKMVDNYHGNMSGSDLVEYMYYNTDFYGAGNSIYEVLSRKWHREWKPNQPQSPETVAHYKKLLPQSMEYTKELILKELEEIGYVMEDIEVTIDNNKLTVSNKYLQLSNGLKACSTIKTWTEEI